MFTKEVNDQIMHVLVDLIDNANKLNPEKNGCVIVIFNKNTGRPLFQELIGAINFKGSAEINYWYHATEKAKRLYENLANGHVTSAQSANMETNYPGAVLCGDYIVSVSGQNMWLDEAIAANLGLIMNWLESLVLDSILSNPNQRYDELALVA